jgi:hypothetical protein
MLSHVLQARLLRAALAVALCAMPLAPSLAQDAARPIARPDPFPGAATPRALDEAALDRLRGGHEAAADVDIAGELHGNSAHDITTGVNALSDGSFANAAGLSTVIQNSGANVLIQNATTVNVVFRP